MLFSRYTLPQLIALFAGLLSIFTIGLTFAIWATQVDPDKLCVPFISGCTSITNTGLNEPQTFLFRGGMISCGMVILLWWFVMQRFLLQYKRQYWGFWLKSMFWGSSFASVCVIVSVAVMGPTMEDSKTLVQVHTASAVLFFLITTVNQSVLTWWLKKSVEDHDLELKTLTVKQIINIGQVICLAIIFTHTLIYPLGHHLTNTIEWWIALLSCVYFLSALWDWDDFKLIEEDQ